LSRIWNDWVPGVLSNRQVRELIKESHLLYIDPESEDVDLSAINLKLSKQAWQMTRGAVKPFGADYEYFLNRSGYAKSIGFEGRIELEPRTTYVFRLQLEFDKEFREARRFHGHATGRSSVGRVDVLTRLIVDGMDQYEGFTAEQLASEGSGKLFLEVTPITFRVAVRPDTALSQLRLFFGTPESCLIKGSDIVESTLRVENRSHADGVLCLSLEPEQHDKISAFRADVEDKVKTPRPAIPLWKNEEKEKPDPAAGYWERVMAEGGVKNRDWFLPIEHGRFYILKSHERLRLPGGVAVYCKPSDETIGEMRIHYAGFVHPWFGSNRADNLEGTPLIFEVRGHDLPTVLGHKEKLARLEYYRMSDDPARPENKKNDRYENQSLQLSTFFREWKS
jgi:deoxycytidine triphosphate deaminase